MNNLRKFYDAAEKDEKIKQTLISANEKVVGMKEEEVKREIIKLGAQFGYDISEEDFEAPEEELGDGAVEKVVGGISSFCIFANAGCTVVGEIDSKGGCIGIGLF